MIQINSLHYNHTSSTRSTRSHVLTPHDAVTLFCIIDGESESIVSVIEDHILESVSSTEWDIHETSQDFSYITEHYNSFVQSFAEAEIRDIRIVIGMLQWIDLTISTVGGTHALFVEKDDTIIDITVHENKSYEFHSITNGKIPVGSTVYIANDDIESLLGHDVLIELSRLPSDTWSTTTRQILEREIASSIHMIRLSNQTDVAPVRTNSRDKRKQSDILRDRGALLVEYIRSQKMWERTKWLIQKLPTLQNKKYQYVFLGFGIVILFALAYSLISSVLSVIDNTTTDNKNELVKAKILVDDSQKLTNNPTLFNSKIGEAEKILFELRKDQVHMLDTQNLLSRITVMKKEVYDIQTIDLTNMISLIPFNPVDISPLGVIEKDKKLILIWENGAINNYIPGDKTIKIVQYPGGEQVRSFDMGEDGSIYLLTNQNHILSPRRDEFAYVNVTGQNSWENALSIKTFNGNIYLLDSSKTQILRHKPGVNGFSQKSSLLEKPQSAIFDISIDGGVYFYMDDGKILRYTGDATNLTPIILNKIPWEWNLDTSKNSVFITRSYLSYTYILNGNHIWIFKPDSKRFQDVKSWSYIGQFEINTEDIIKSINIPKDGSIYLTTNRWVYNLKFEFVDNKVVFK